MRLDTMERQVGAPSIGIHRADLLRRLSGEVSGGRIHVNAHCVGFRLEQGNVISHFADGQQQQTDLLVGADGLHSVIREQLLGKQPPRYSGYTCWRGVAVFEDQHVSGGISSETWGCGLRFGMLPIGNGRVFWSLNPENAGTLTRRSSSPLASNTPSEPAVTTYRGAIQQVASSSAP
jgi:2-polyprenyl-6-methoxyphenol hydroxylase-like FAD-dependent oxidoreductase